MYNFRLHFAAGRTMIIEAGWGGIVIRRRYPPNQRSWGFNESFELPATLPIRVRGG
jgi:hypothetical protein